MFQFKMFGLNKNKMAHVSKSYKQRLEVKINLIISEDNDENVIFHKPIFIIFFI